MSLMYNDLEGLPAEKLIAPRLSVLLVGHNSFLLRLPPRFFVGLLHLRVLDLSHTGIRVLPAEALRCLEGLVLLDLSYCKELEAIPDSIGHLRNLEELRLIQCSRVNALPRGACFLKKLQAVLLEDTEVWDQGELRRTVLRWRPHWILTGGAILEDVSCLISLTNFSVSSYTLTAFRVDFQSLRMLRHLAVKLSHLRSFPDPSMLKDLESLKLHCSSLTELPEGITTLSNLTKLEVNCSALPSLPALDQLTRLRHLDISQCKKLQHVPESFGRDGSFPSLEELRMDSCFNLVFPNLNPGAMSRLSALSLVRCHQLDQPPVCLGVLRNLRGLDLSYCTNLKTLEPAFDVNSFPRLEHLRLTHTRVTQLPVFLATRPSLVKLDLTECPAGDSLPPEFQNVEGLKIITSPEDGMVPE